MNFTSLSSTIRGDGDIYYQKIATENAVSSQQQIVMLIRMLENVKLKLGGPVPADFQDWRTQVSLTLIDCDKNKFTFKKTEYYDAANNLLFMGIGDPTKDVLWADFESSSPFGMLKKIVCMPKEAQQ